MKDTIKNPIKQMKNRFGPPSDLSREALLAKCEAIAMNDEVQWCLFEKVRTHFAHDPLFRKTTKKNIAVLAQTGVTALNIKGQTIHSFFGFRPNINVQKVKSRKKSQSTIISNW